MNSKSQVNPRMFNGRVGFQQRVLPAYRVMFFDSLATSCTGGMSLFAGNPGPDESILTTTFLDHATLVLARNRHFLSVQSPYYLLWQDGIRRWLEDWNPDALILEANSRYLTNRQAVRWMHARSRPVIGWGLGAPPFLAKNAFRRTLDSLQAKSRRKFLLSLDAIIAYSRRGADEYHAEGFPKERIFIASNAVASRPEHALPIRPSYFDGKPKILFVGRLQARKRIDNLLRASKILPETLQPEIWIVGDGPARREFEDLAKDIYPTAKFLGSKYGEELKSYFMAADLFVLPGTGGLAVQEAMAYGLPVIVAQGDGTQDDLIRPTNGWSIPPDDADALNFTMKEALTDPIQLRKMGMESYRIVAEEVNLETMVNVFLEALNRITSTYQFEQDETTLHC